MVGPWPWTHRMLKNQCAAHGTPLKGKAGPLWSICLDGEYWVKAILCSFAAAVCVFDRLEPDTLRGVSRIRSAALQPPTITTTTTHHPPPTTCHACRT